MLPRLEDRDRLFVNKFVYHFSAIEHGDVVVFRYPATWRRATSSASSRCPATSCVSSMAVCAEWETSFRTYVPLEYRDNRSMAEIVVLPAPIS